MLIHFILIPFFAFNIFVAFFLDKLHNITSIKAKLLPYIKVVVLLILWLIYVVLSFVLSQDIYIKMIYLGSSFLNIIICIFIVSRQEKKHKPETNVYGSWKLCSKELQLSFKIRKHNQLDLPIIYGNRKSIYIEIFPYNEKFSNGNFDTDLKTIISVRVFKKENPNKEPEAFSYEQKFKEKMKNFSYLETHIKPDWSKLNIPELPSEFIAEVDNIITSSKISFDSNK